MTAKQILTVVAIILSVLIVVGLILCRPMSSDSYAPGLFSFAAVSDITVSAGEYSDGSAPPEELVLTEDDPAFDRLIGLFDVRGFGMTPAGLFSDSLPALGNGDVFWSVTFNCRVSGSTLTAEYAGGKLRLTGRSSTLVTTQDKEEWAMDVYGVISPLYPNNPEEDTGVSQ